MGSEIKSIFKFPKRIYSENFLLKIYKREFPEIVKEFEQISRKIFYQPNYFCQIVASKALVFDSVFTRMQREYHKSTHSLSALLRINFTLHRNYALNFWLISYLIIESRFISHCVKEFNCLIQKAFSGEKSEYLKIKSVLLKTDYPINYYKILHDGLSLISDLDKIYFCRALLRVAKSKSSFRDRRPVYDRIITYFKDTFPDLAKKNNVKGIDLMIYNRLEMGISFYPNKYKEQLFRKFDSRTKLIKRNMRRIKNRLNHNDFMRFTNLYSLIRETIRAKESVFSNRDPKLFLFAKMLADKILIIAKKELGLRFLNIRTDNLLFLWKIEKFIPLKLRRKMRGLDILYLKDVSINDAGWVGSKGASLGELSIKFLVPAGFCITSNVFMRFLEENKLEHKIFSLIDRIKINDIRQLINTSKKLSS